MFVQKEMKVFKSSKYFLFKSSGLRNIFCNKNIIFLLHEIYWKYFYNMTLEHKNIISTIWAVSTKLRENLKNLWSNAGGSSYPDYSDIEHLAA